jgi:hypothetical protein
MQEIGIMLVLGLSGLVMGIFFILRALKRLKAWRDGDKDELWAFLGLIIGAGLSLLLGIGLATVGTGFSEIMLVFTFPILLYLSLVPIGLFTYYYILKWLDAK